MNVVTRRAATAPFLVLMLSGLFVVAGTNARPASASIGIPDWAKVALPAAAAGVSVTVNAAASVGSAVMMTAAAGGGAIASGAVATVTAAELAGIEASYALPAVGSAATGVGVCAGTAGVACAVGGALAAGVGGYALFKFFTDTSGGAPNTDLTSAGTLQADGRCVAYVSGTCSSTPNGSSLSVAWSQPGAVGTVYTKLYCGSQATPGAYTQDVSAAGGSDTFSGIDVRAGCATGTADRSIRVGPAVSCVDASGATGVCVPNPRFVAWYVAQTAPAPTAPPDRQLVTSRACVASGGAVTTVTGTGPTFVEAAGVRAVAAYPACPAGTSVRDTSVISHTLDGGAPDKNVVTYTAPTTGPYAVAPGVEPAPVVLYELQPDGSYQTCEQTPSPCAGWWSDPTKTDRFQCRQGSVVLVLSDCDGIARRYEPKLPSVSQEQGCFAGMGLSPLTWPRGLVLSPLKCLFIPDATKIQGDVDTIRATWDTKPPSVLYSGVSKLTAPLSPFTGHSQGNCNGPTFTLHFLGPNVDLSPFYACDGLMQKLSSVVLPLSTFLVYMTGFFVGLRLVTSTIGLGMPAGG